MKERNVKDISVLKAHEIEELLSGIRSEAEKESEQILKEAESWIAIRKESVIKEIASIRREAEKRAASQAEMISKNTAAVISVQEKRGLLKLRDEIFSLVEKKTAERFEKIAEAPEYRDILKSWVIEGYLGLESFSILINGPEKERALLKDILPEAVKEIRELTGRDVKLNLSSEAPLLTRGIMLVSEDNQTAFSNLVPARINRYQQKIRALIYSEIFGD